MASSDFPTAQTLRQANELARNQLTYDDDGLPNPIPPTKTKDEIFVLSKFKTLDEKACQAPKRLLDQPLTELVDYLIRGTSTELERVRVIFRWITAQNLEDTSGQDVGQPITALEYLIGIKNNTVTYSTLMANMCSSAKIATKIIRGYAKHVKYEIGENMSTSMEGSWMAVLIDNTWYLMDVNWSSRHTTGVNEYYFLTNPEELIYSHFPNESQWQLLAREVSVQEFEQMAFLKPHFFRCGLLLREHEKCIIEAPEGDTRIQLGMKEGFQCKFMYELWISMKGNTPPSSDMYKDKKLSQFVFMQNRGGEVECDIHFPLAGKFRLDLFCNSDSTNLYKLACKYIIKAAKASENAKATPKNIRTEWGPGADLVKSGFTPMTHTDGQINLEKGETELRFKNESKNGILACLHTDKKTKEELTRYVIHYTEEEELVIKVRLPEKDDYVLNIFANNGDETDSTYSNVCSYLVTTSEPADNPEPFPSIPNGRLGFVENNLPITIKPISYPSGLVTSPDNGEQMDFTFNMSSRQSYSLLTKLMLHQNGEEKEMVNFTYVTEPSRDERTVSTRFPQTGQYILKIFGRIDDDDTSTDTSYYPLYTYLIQVNEPTNHCQPFPQAFQDWNSSCRLVEPNIMNPIFANTTILFRVKIPEALKVAIISKESGRTNWTHLSQHGELWTGDVETGVAGSQLQLSAAFNDDSTSYNGLLRFEVVQPWPKIIISVPQPKRTGETDTPIRQHKPVKKEPEQTEQTVLWKAKFSMEQRRKTLSEKEYRIQRAKQLQPKLDELIDTSKKKKVPTATLR